MPVSSCQSRGRRRGFRKKNKCWYRLPLTIIKTAMLVAPSLFTTKPTTTHHPRHHYATTYAGTPCSFAHPHVCLSSHVQATWQDQWPVSTVVLITKAHNRRRSMTLTPHLMEVRTSSLLPIMQMERADTHVPADMLALSNN